MRDIDRELARLVESQSHSGASDAVRAELNSQAGTLTILRDQLESARSPVALAHLQFRIGEAVRSAGDLVQSASATTASSGVLSDRQLTQAVYHARMSSLEQSMRGIVDRDTKLFSSAEVLAAKHGIDLGAFNDTREALETEAEEARRKGDRFSAMMADTLKARNTANALDQVAAGITDPADKAIAMKKAEEARRNAETAEQRLRDAAEAEAAKEAAGVTFASDEERQRFIRAKADERMDQYTERRAALPKAAGVDEARERLADMAIARRINVDSGRSESADVDPFPIKASSTVDRDAAYARVASGLSSSDLVQPVLPPGEHVKATQAAAGLIQSIVAEEPGHEGKQPALTPGADARSAKSAASVTI